MPGRVGTPGPMFFRAYMDTMEISNVEQIVTPSPKAILYSIKGDKENICKNEKKHGAFCVLGSESHQVLNSKLFDLSITS